MLSNVFWKTLYEKRWTLLWWCIGIMLMTWFTMIFYPSFSQQGADQFAESVPDSLKSLVGSVESFKTIPGYIAQQIYGPNVPIFTIVMAILLFNGLGVGEEEKGQLETLLAQPVSRTTVFLQKFWAVSLLLTIACLAIAIGVLASMPFIHESVNLLRLSQSTFACLTMTLAYGTIVYALGMATGRKGFTLGVACGYTFASFLVTSLAPSVKALQTADKLSIFHYYNDLPVMTHGITYFNLMVMVLIIAGLLIISLPLFKKRDLNT